MALGELVDEFETEIGRRPWTVEVAELIAWGLRSIPGDLIADLVPAAVVRVEITPRGESPPDGSQVSELNDACFVAAAELVQAAAADIESAGVAPLTTSVCDRIAAELRANVHLLGDDPPPTIARVAVIAKKSAKRTKVGDLVAIPASKGEFYVAVVIAKNRFGVAFGLFEGRHPAAPVTIAKHPEVRRHPVYSGDPAISSGRWKVIGHDDALRALFPNNPEIFHRAGPATGPHGIGETADGAIRELSEEEERELGLRDGTYDAILLTDELEQYLNDQPS